MDSEYLQSLLDNFSINWIELYVVIGIGIGLSRLILAVQTRHKVTEDDRYGHLVNVLGEKVANRALAVMLFIMLIISTSIWPLWLISIALVKIKERNIKKEKDSE